MKKLFAFFIAIQFLVLGKLQASDWVSITDMSQLSYQIANDKVWLRNVNKFDSTWLGCCVAYYVDLTSNNGKATWSAMLVKIAARDKYNIGVVDKTKNSSPVTFSGNW